MRRLSISLERRVFAYLQKRGIAAQIIRGFIDSGLLYEDSLHHNCVFVGREASGSITLETGAVQVIGAALAGEHRLTAGLPAHEHAAPAQGKDWNECLLQRGRTRERGK